MTRGQTYALAFAVVVLVATVIGMVATSTETAKELGPYPTGDGDAVVVTPRAAP